MRYRRLGASGFKVSVLSFGAWQIGDTDFWGPHDPIRAEATVQAAIDAGINLFDTAEMYGQGESERALGRALGKRRSEVYIASKVSPEHCAPGLLRAACESSLERLGTDYLDLYQVHWPPRNLPFGEVYAEMSRLKDEGKIRAIGVSNFGPQDLMDWQHTGETVSNQVGYNFIFRAVEYAIAPACRKTSVGMLAYMPLMQGLLAGRWNSVEDIPLMRRRTRHFAAHREGVRHGERGCEGLLLETLTELADFADDLHRSMASVSLAWLMAQPGVTSVIVGGRDPEQLTRNLEAVDLYLGPAVMARLNEISGPLKNRLGANADMWQSGDGARIR
jgi:aryl-alcohol dehydrogenase-like predicted oxidoreductase